GVHQDEHSPIAGVLDDILDPRNVVVIDGNVHPFTSLATYRASRSISILTFSVCGIMFTPNRTPSTSFTVRDTPSRATEPFGAINRAKFAGASNVTRVDSPSAATCWTSAVPST